MYSVPKLPGSHSPESVIRVLDEYIKALVTEAEAANTVGRDTSVFETPSAVGPSLTPDPPPPTLSAKYQTKPVTKPVKKPVGGPLTSHPVLPDLTQEQHPPKSVSASSGGSVLINVPDFTDIPIVNPDPVSIDELLFAQPASLLAPQLPSLSSPGAGKQPGPEQHRNLAPQSRYLSVRKEREKDRGRLRGETAPPQPQPQPQPQMRRRTGSRDLKERVERAVTLPELTQLPPRQDPACLKVGSRVMTDCETVVRPKALRLSYNDSLKIRPASGVRQEDLPEVLKLATGGTGLSPGPHTEMDCLISAVDVVKNDFDFGKLQLDPLEPELGLFSCGFDSPTTNSQQSTRAGGGTSKDETAKVRRSDVSSGSKSRSSDTTSTAESTTTRPNSTARSSSSSRSASNESLPRVVRPPGPINMPLPDRPLSPLPLVPDPKDNKHLLTPAASLALSNATLKALLAAEDASSHTYDSSIYDLEARLAKSRLSQRSQGVVRDFDQYTHGRFFPPDMRSWSEGAAAGLAGARRGAIDEQVRSRSVGSLAERKAKGRGIIFDR